VTDVERASALEAIAQEIRACTRCRLHETRSRAVPGEGNPDTEVALVGEGPGFNEDRLGRPFVGRAGTFLERLLGSIGWAREDVFITNIVKCRPPDNRDPEPDEIAACAPYLRRQLEALDPTLVVTLGRHSMGRFMPGARISSAHGTARPADPGTGAGGALVFAMYHPAAALRATEIERLSLEDAAAIPGTLVAARARRETGDGTPRPATEAAHGEAPRAVEAGSSASYPTAAQAAAQPPAASAAAPAAVLSQSTPASTDDQLTLFQGGPQ
jgi:DNA polymerase